MTVLKINFLSKYLGYQTNVTICLPRPHQEDGGDFYRPGMKFQTLYLLHGYSGDNTDYVDFTSIVRYADEARVAVVMPAGYNAFYTDDPHGPRYWRYVSEELPQVCQSLFPLSAKREDNFVAGLSMGGDGAMKVGIMKCEAYAAVLCMSGASMNPDELTEVTERRRARQADAAADDLPTIDMATLYGDPDHFKGSVNDVWHYAKLNVEAKKRLPKFLITVGDKDFLREQVEDANAYLTGLGFDSTFELVPGYGHEWDFWDLTLRKALREWLPLRRTVIYPDEG